MLRPRSLSFFKTTTAFALLFLVAIALKHGVAISAPQSNSNVGDEKNTAEQIKELQKQVSDLQKPRIIAAGTATFKLGAQQDNATNVRVTLSDEIAARIGEDYIVLLTNRFPVGGYPFFSPYWKRATNGFDITLVDVSLGSNSFATYANRNKTYLIDWIVVKK